MELMDVKNKINLFEIFFDRWALSIVAFSVFGFLFLFKPTTLIPTLVFVLGGCFLLLSKSWRQKFMMLFSRPDLKLIAWPFLLWFFVELFVASIHHAHGLVQSFPSNALRFVFALTLLCLTVRSEVKKYFYFGLIVGAFVAALWGGVEVMVLNDIERAQGPTNNPIHFGNLTAILSLMCLSIALLATDLTVKLRSLLLVATLLAAFASMTSYTRSSFFIFLCVIPLALFRNKDKFHEISIKIFGVGLVVAVFAIFGSQNMQDKLRIHQFKEMSSKSENVNYMAVTSNRSGMWQTAWILFKTHPFVGVGPDGFQSNFESFLASGVISSDVTGDAIPNQLHNQPHNDILYSASTGGVLKLAAYCFIIFGPFLFFYRQYKNLQIKSVCRVVPMLGMQVVAAYFLTGLTNSNFDLQIYCTTYAVLVCLLAKISIQEKILSFK
jgi:O-antigen ligase